MSVETVQEVVVKAVMDSEYRELLFKDLDKALEGFELSEEERTRFKEMSREKFDAASSDLEERISRAGFRGIGTVDIFSGFDIGKFGTSW